MIRVREPVPVDEAAIATVVASGIATLRQTYRPTPVAVARKADLVLHRLVADDDEAIVGTVEYACNGERLHLMGLYTLDTHRRHGVARRMIDALVVIANARGARTLSLYTIRETGNVPIFERLGFTVVREAPARDCASDRHAHLTETYLERRLAR